MTDLVLRNNENRPSLTSGAAAVAERQEASSKNTISAHGPPPHLGPRPPTSESGASKECFETYFISFTAVNPQWVGTTKYY